MAIVGPEPPDRNRTAVAESLPPSEVADRMFAFLRRLRTRPSIDVLIECRHCGTSVDRGMSNCPACGMTEFAHYEFTA